jgi:hypothetical protein
MKGFIFCLATAVKDFAERRRWGWLVNAANRQRDRIIGRAGNKWKLITLTRLSR